MQKQLAKLLPLGLAPSIVVVGLFVGCEKSETKPASSSGAAPAANDAAKTASDAAKSADNAAKSAADSAKAAGDSAKTAADSAANSATATASDAKAAAAAPGDKPTDAAAATGDAKAQATDLLTKVTTYVKENKMDLAEKSLAELDKLKPQLPQEYQAKIDTAHTMFDAAKKGQGLDKLKDGLLGK